MKAVIIVFGTFAIISCMAAWLARHMFPNLSIWSSVLVGVVAFAGCVAFMIRVAKSQRPMELVIELRGNDEIKLAKESVNGRNVPIEAAEIRNLVEEAFIWGKQRGWPLHERYPQYAQLRDLGRTLFERGGKREMQRVYYYLQAQDPECSSWLSYVWNGVGTWRA